MKQKWYSLLAQMEILGNQKGTLNEETILTFEKETGIILPNEYKEFCQIFGGGTFGSFVSILRPSSHMLEMSSLTLYAIKTDFREYLWKKTEDTSTKATERILDFALRFAEDYFSNYIAIWDLRTYNKLDQSYDIYWLKWDGFEGDIYYLGRSVFEFVRDFCLGMKSYEILPESMHPHPQSLHHTFTPFA